MNYPESVLENETHNILGGFEIETDPLIPARRPDLMLIKKEILPPCKLCHYRGQLGENKRKRKDKY